MVASVTSRSGIKQKTQNHCDSNDLGMYFGSISVVLFGLNLPALNEGLTWCSMHIIYLFQVG